MLTNNVDLNYEVDILKRCGDWATLIDEVAFQGNLFLVETLLNHGARLTADTLPCAIKSWGTKTSWNVYANWVLELISKGWSKQSALATALSAQNASMIKLVYRSTRLGIS